MSEPARVPVTILTGFLGAGKTTLLNRILSEQHGHRIAVIENEYGEIGIDHALVINADEEVFEMSNGCICCTVRGDLIRVLGNLMKRRERFDYVLVETTGLADPGPVAQTFFMDDDIRESFVLDGIVTLVDAAHVSRQLGRSDECAEQIAFADVLLLNKCDLVPADTLDALEARIRQMNRSARLLRATHGRVPVEAVLGLRAFDIGQALARRPTFLEPEYPFEWSGVYAPGPRPATLRLAAGPDPAMDILVMPAAGTDDAALRADAERAVRIFAAPAVPVSPGGEIPPGVVARLALDGPGPFDFVLPGGDGGPAVLLCQHTAAEFNLAVHTDPTGAALEPLAERTWVAQHEHDDAVRSVAIESAGAVDGAALSAWIGTLLQTRGPDIFRMKGILNVAGEDDRFVFQGVHMLFDGQRERPWGDRPRINQLVFIGRDLDEAAIRAGFAGCLT